MGLVLSGTFPSCGSQLWVQDPSSRGPKDTTEEPTSLFYSLWQEPLGTKLPREGKKEITKMTCQHSQRQRAGKHRTPAAARAIRQECLSSTFSTGRGDGERWEKTAADGRRRRRRRGRAEMQLTVFQVV